MAQMIARHSSSMVAYHCWVGVNDFEPQVMIACAPCTSWHSANPIPWCREASVSSVTCFDGSKCLVRRLVVSIAFSCSNSWLCSGSHWKALSFPRSCLMAAVAWEKSGMKKESCWARPRNDLTSVRFVGFGKSFIARILSGSGLTPFSPRGSRRIVFVCRPRIFFWTM